MLRVVPHADGPDRLRARELRRRRRSGGRIDETRQPIDASGVLPDGTRFDGLAGFRAALLANPEQFVNDADGEAA